MNSCENSLILEKYSQLAMETFVVETLAWKFQAKWRGVSSLEKHVLLKKLRDLLEALRGQVIGRNKDEVDKAITMVYLIFFIFLCDSFLLCCSEYTTFCKWKIVTIIDVSKTYGL